MKMVKFEYELKLSEFFILSTFTTPMHQIRLLRGKLGGKQYSTNVHYVHIVQEAPEMAVLFSDGKEDVEEDRDYMTKFFYIVVGNILGVIPTEKFKETYPNIEEIDSLKMEESKDSRLKRIEIPQHINERLREYSRGTGVNLDEYRRKFREYVECFWDKRASLATNQRFALRIVWYNARNYLRR